MLKRIALGIVLLLVLAAAVLAALGRGWGGRFDSEDYTPRTAPLEASRVAAALLTSQRDATQARVPRASRVSTSPRAPFHASQGTGVHILRKARAGGS